MPNRLAEENSPYLLQHAGNPVDWYPWSQEALQRAVEEDKPVFLSIGYAACHWCHVMAHESFEDPDTAALMNAGFINIKVDREERPDLDQVYMQAVVAISGNGGWPMSVFLTPDGKPFYGGTYFPPVRRYNMPSFREILSTVARLWQEDRPRLFESSQQITQQVFRSQFLPSSTGELEASVLEQASLRLAQGYDWKHGGWGSAPKFPQPMAIEFLLRRSLDGDRLALDVALHALQAMARGGMYDVIGGGFARYSTDERWLVPHFEKMLYDNAQLARVYLHAFMLTGDPFLKQVCEQTLDFMLRELSDQQSNPDSGALGFYSSLDADSEGVEGKYYVWDQAEILQVLSSVAQAGGNIPASGLLALFEAAYSLTGQSNFEDHYVLQRQLDDQALAARFGLEEKRVKQLLDEAHRALLAEREKRIRPGLDDKALTSWNALAVSAFAEAARYLRREDYLQAARRNAAFLLDNMVAGDRLLRSWRQGRARHPAYLEDYAGLVLALLDLYQSDADLRWFSGAGQLCTMLLEGFSDPSGGFYDTHHDQDNLIVRPKDLQDNATPCGNSQAARALLAMSAFNGSSSLRSQAEDMLASIQEVAAQVPTAFAGWLSAIDAALHPPQEVVLLGDPAHPISQSFVDILWKEFRPHVVLALSPADPAPGSPPVLLGKSQLNRLPTAFVCRNFVCQLPTNDPQDFESQLHGHAFRNPNFSS